MSESKFECHSNLPYFKKTNIVHAMQQAGQHNIVYAGQLNVVYGGLQHNVPFLA